MFKHLKVLIEKLESMELGFGLWISSALFIIIIRNSLECVVEYGKFPSMTSFDLLHVPISFMTTLVSIIVVLYFLTRENIERISRVCLIFFSLILLPVLVDALRFFFIGSGTQYSYLFDNVWVSYLNFLNPFFQMTTLPWGMRLEIALFGLLGAVYVWVKTKSWLKTGLGFFLVNTLIFCFVAMPGILIGTFSDMIYPFYKAHFSGKLGADLEQTVIVIVWLLLSVLVVNLWCRAFDLKKWRALIGNIRPTRCIHYGLLVLLGLKFSGNVSVSQNFFVLIKILGTLAALFFACQFSAIINDIVDYRSDRVTEPTRPYAAGFFTTDDYLRIGFVYLAWALLFSLWISDNVFSLILLFIGGYFIYSMPPFRLKRSWFLSGIILGAEAVLAFLIGYLAFGEPEATITIDPLIPTLIFLVFFLSGHVKDLKDVEGDRAEGVSTLPVVLGAEQARYVIGCLMGASYLLVPLFLWKYLRSLPLGLLVAVCFAAGNYLYVRRKDAKEDILFGIYFTFTLILLIGLIG